MFFILRSGANILVKTVMDQHVYVDILENVMLPHAEEQMPLLSVFPEDNDPKQAERLVNGF